MKLAVSNLAWDHADTPELLPRFERVGVEGLVIAPTMVWADAPHTAAFELADFRRRLEHHELAVAGLQSLLFNVKGMSLFGSEEERRNLAEHLKRQAQLGGELGARSLIFGSPGFRKKNDLTPEQRMEMAAEVFGQVARVAESENTVLAIEPLSEYGNDFVMTTEEGVALVKAVGHPGFGLHLDGAAVSGAGEDPSKTIPYAIRAVGIASFDASAPGLGLVSADKTVNHEALAAALRSADYKGYISLEVKMPKPLTPNGLISELAYVASRYGL